MFVRKVAVRLKLDALESFRHLVKSEILPWLRQQEGFMELIVLVSLDRREVQALSFWEQEGNAQACNSGGCPAGMIDHLDALVDGGVHGKVFEVVSSTLARFATAESELGTAVQEMARSLSVGRAISPPGEHDTEW